jgi:Family of unknown function (DUF5709)
MPDKRRHESADLEDYQVLDSYDTLDGAPGDDPLDRGVVTPERWSAGMRFGSTGAEQRAGESLDQLLAEEEPDAASGAGDERPEDLGWDENATDEDVGRFELDQGPDARAGRLLAASEGTYSDGEFDLAAHDDLVGRDAGIDGGGASAEEAAVHVLDDEER